MPQLERIAIEAEFEIRILLFARFRDALGTSAINVVLPPRATVRDIREQFSRLNPGLTSLLDRSQIAVNSEPASDEAIVQPGDEIALLPPVSGG